MATRGKGIRSSAQDNFIAPNAPTGVSATDVGTGRAFNNGAATITFSAPTTGNTVGITSYTATSSPGGFTASGASSPLTVTGLQSNTSYTFTVTATNAYGTSAASSASASITATTVPATPSAPTVSSVSNQATDVVTWTAPATGGKAITGYTWSSSDGKSGSTASTSVNVAQEAGTAQTYNVYATNDNGNSGTSANSASFTSFSFTPFGFVPFAPFSPFSPFAPFSPFSPGFSEYSVASNTGIMTIDGRKDAKDLVVGDQLISMEIGSLDPHNPNWLDWSTENLILNDTNLRVSTVTNISSYQTNQLYLINGDLYSESHYILTKKDNVSKFVRVSDIDTSYMVYSYSELGFVEISSMEIVEYEETVYSINCEPYDNFFTENMLVFDARDPEQA